MLLIVSRGAKSHSIDCPGGGCLLNMPRGSQLPNCSSTGGVHMEQPTLAQTVAATQDKLAAKLDQNAYYSVHGVSAQIQHIASGLQQRLTSLHSIVRKLKICSCLVALSTPFSRPGYSKNLTNDSAKLCPPVNYAPVKKKQQKLVSYPAPRQGGRPRGTAAAGSSLVITLLLGAAQYIQTVFHGCVATMQCNVHYR